MRTAVRSRASAALEFERLVHRLVHELLDDRLAPGAEGARAESAAEPFDPRNADSSELDGVSVEHHHSRVGEDLADFDFLSRLDIVVAEYGRRGHAQRDELARKHARLLRSAVVGEVAGKQQHLG